VYAAKSALMNSINAGRLKATMRHNAYTAGWDQYPNVGETMRPISDDDNIPPRL
jgi:hypothetical protein